MIIIRGFLFCSLALLLLSAAPVPVSAQNNGFPLSIHQLVGEDYRYAIDFLFFKKLAQGQLRFTETAQPGVYRAELTGQTLGVAAWLAGERTQNYTSLMEMTADGSLRSIEHVSKVFKSRRGKSQNRMRRFHYDYAQGKIYDEKLIDGVSRSKRESDIPNDRQPVDLLTAFYNLRIGVYGALVRGAHMRIPTFSSKGFSEIEVKVLTLERHYEQRYFPARGLLVQVKIDPEIFDTGSGNLFVWFDDAGVPGRGIVEELIGLGDARGYLDREGL